MMNIRKATTAALLCLAWLSIAFSPALAAEQRIFDSGDLFSPSEEQEIYAVIARLQEDTGMDFVILTSRDAYDGESAETIADDFYDRGEYGFDEEHSGVLYYINMYERYQHLSTTGSMIDYMTDERITSAIDACQPFLSANNYKTAALTMLNKIEDYLKAGVPEGQYRYDVITGERLTARHKVLTPMEMLVSAAIAVVLGLLYAVVIKRSYQLKGSTYRYQYRSNCDLRMTDTEDTFLHTTTTRMPKPSNGGGSGGGFSGGSGTHTGSSGTSHGGGGGRF